MGGLQLPMRETIRRLSPRSEFFLVIALCFGYFAFASAAALFVGTPDLKYTSGRVVQSIVIELILLSAAGWVLHVRGWKFRRLGFDFSWAGLLAGIPLFIAYLVLYWGTYLFAVSVYPAARNVQAPKIVPTAPFALFAVFIILNSLFEEAAVTGYVVSKLSEQGFALSITASALIRFVYHLYQGPIASLAILPLGFLFAAVYWRWRNLWPLMSAHTIANLIVFAAGANRAA